jgi:Holliday junction resolvasome RuvABC endonuclease subunit
VRRKQRGVIGLDLSITAPAGCFIPPGWRLGVWEDLRYSTFPQILKKEQEQLEELSTRYARLIEIGAWVLEFVRTHNASDVYVENYGFSRSSSSVTRLAELGGVVRTRLFESGILLRPVTASHARKILLGQVPKKDSKTETHLRLWKHNAPFANGDECDAFCVANAGLSDLGFPCMMLHEAH